MDMVNRAADALVLRPPQEVMRLSRMGAAFPTRLSFMRSLIRRIGQEKWAFDRVVWDLDASGYGRAVWSIRMPSGTVSFAAFSNDLAAEERTDRVIAEKWDASFVLVEGEIDAADLARLEQNVPRQEAGRLSAKELVLSRANKSVRLFDAVVDALAAGRQPDIRDILKVGYLMRTTAVYGNGKFGLGDFPLTQAHPELDGPYRAEMLCVYMIRHFQCELAEHVAQARGGARAVKLDPTIRRAFGIGNATGLGMAPFLIRHPILIHHWIAAKETALASVLALEAACPEDEARYRKLLARARAHVAEWNVEEPRQQERIEVLRSELSELAVTPLSRPFPWQRLYRSVNEKFGLETQELVAALLIELYPQMVDALAETMSASEPERIDGMQSVGSIIDVIKRDYQWALGIDYDDPEQRKYFWYYSEAKEEPRLGQRFAEPGAEREMRLGIGHMVKQFHTVLKDVPRDQPIAVFLLKHPEWRLAARRIETTRRFPFAEIRDNTIGANLLPIDLLRCKLAFFGATKFDPKSDLWTRITMYQGAPLIDELQNPDSDDWWLPAWLS
ncbi:MAG: hypothetical protein JNJ53_01120 [Rhizobiales bacterium]|nr:hypothetical protein [Hyphomicrobiales bacterium]